MRVELNTQLSIVAERFPGWLRLIGRAKSEVIESAFGISAREVRLVVQFLRSLGDAEASRIGSDGDGYFWSDQFEDFDGTISNLESRARSIFAGARGIRSSFKQDGQEVMDL